MGSVMMHCLPVVRRAVFPLSDRTSGARATAGPAARRLTVLPRRSPGGPELLFGGSHWLAGVQIVQIRAPLIVIGIEPTVAQNCDSDTMPFRLLFPSAPERARATAVPAVTGAEEAGVAGFGMEVASHRGIPNFGGNPGRIMTVCPTKIRYTLLGQRWRRVFS